VLLDGFLCGLWRLERDRDSGAATLSLTHAGKPTKRAASALTAEGRRLLRFLAPHASQHDVRLRSA
jgi:hypothetical protein